MGAVRGDPVPGVPTLTGDRLGWEHFPHGADIGVRGWGTDLNTAFAQAALATTAIVADPLLIKPETSIDIRCEATSLEDLFVEWLNAVIFEMSSRQLVFGSFTVATDDHRLSASARGETLDPERHDPGVEPKGATYTMLSVSRREEGVWVAQCVVDV
jgi:SHS2 domain-containing protein